MDGIYIFVHGGAHQPWKRVAKLANPVGIIWLRDDHHASAESLQIMDLPPLLQLALETVAQQCGQRLSLTCAVQRPLRQAYPSRREIDGQGMVRV
jgi:hypothetical protein